MNRINNDTSSEFCNSQQDKRVQYIRNEFRQCDIILILDFQEDFRNFEVLTQISFGMNEKVSDSLDANVKRSIMARSYDGKNVESIYDDIRNSTLNLIDQLAADLGSAQAGKF